MPSLGQFQVYWIKPWQLTDANTGEVKKGCKACYGENYAVDDPSFKGVPLIEVSLPYDLQYKFSKVPAKYELIGHKVPGSAGKPAREVITDIKPVAS